MNLFIIYAFLLFVLFIPNYLIKLPYFKDKLIQLVVFGLVFTILIGIGYDFLLKSKESFSINIDSQEGQQPLAKLLAGFINSSPPAKTKVKNYKVNNNVDLSDPSITEDNSELQAMKDELIIKQGEQPITVEEANQGGEENIGWVLTPIIQEKKYERVKQKGMYCGADYNTTTACCGQPPANVPSEYICPETKPYCKNYVAFEKWGTCTGGSTQDNTGKPIVKQEIQYSPKPEPDPTITIKYEPSA